MNEQRAIGFSLLGGQYPNMIWIGVYTIKRVCMYHADPLFKFFKPSEHSHFSFFSNPIIPVAG